MGFFFSLIFSFFKKKLTFLGGTLQVFVAVCRLPPDAVSRDYSSCSAQASCSSGFPCCRAQALGCMGFSSCRVWTRGLWYVDLLAVWHLKSSQTRDRTCIPCIGRWILNPWTTREISTWALYGEIFATIENEIENILKHKDTHRHIPLASRAMMSSQVTQLLETMTENKSRKSQRTSHFIMEMLLTFELVHRLFVFV